MKGRSFLICTMILFVAGVSFQFETTEIRASDTASQKTQSSQSSIDLAAGILDAGELKHTVFNNGLLATWGWTGYIVPDLPAGWYKGCGYIPDLNIWIGIPEGPWTSTYTYWDPGLQDSVAMTGPTVSEAQLHGGFNTSDWDPTPGSLGRYHSGDVTIGDIAPGAPLSTLPLMATSTIPESWPEDVHTNRYWPGPWAIDPETGQEMEGVFTADKEVFFSLTDDGREWPEDIPFASRDELTDQGYPIGVQLDVSGYSFPNPYDDFIFFPMRIINTSEHDYYGTYMGFYCDIDVPEYNVEGIINDRMDWMGFDREYDVAYIFDYRWGSGDWPVTDPEAYQVYCGVKLLETPPDSNGVELGLTDWHWFEWENRPGVVIQERKELIQYKVMSGDASELYVEEESAYFHKDAQGNLDPHFDSPENIQRLYPNGMDCVFLMSTGPFNLAAEETTTYNFALIFGDDKDDFFSNCSLAQALYDSSFIPAYPRVVDISTYVEQVALDTSTVTVKLRTYDRDGIGAVVAIFESPDEVVVDSVFLYDDGHHSDGEASDSLYANSWCVTAPTSKYFLDIAVSDIQSFTARLNNVATFWAGKGVVPPLDLAAEGQENKIYLKWTPNSPGATDGYKIYYDSDGPAPPYEGTDANQGLSPIDIESPLESNCVLSGLTNNVPYYVVITAYDTAGIESGYPDEVSAEPGIYYPSDVGRLKGLSLDQGVELDWRSYETMAPADLNVFYIYRNSVQIGATDETHYLDVELINGLNYTYFVTAVDSAGFESSYEYPLDVKPAPMSPGFPLSVEAPTDLYGATIVNIDGVGNNELVVVTNEEDICQIHLLNLDGSERPGWPVTLRYSNSFGLTDRAIGDVDNDGTCEIVAGSRDYDTENVLSVFVFAWHGDGTTVNGWPREIPGAYYCAVALGDIDNDGTLEVIAGSTNKDLVSGSVWVWNHNGESVEGWPKHKDVGNFAHPTVGDIDGDKGPEILFAADSLYAWYADGANVPGWPQPTDECRYPATIGDIDGNGDVEIVVGTTFSGFVYAWHHHGILVAGWPRALGGPFIKNSALGDIDSDSKPEFVIGSYLYRNGALYVLNEDGSPVSGWPMTMPGVTSFGHPRIADIDGDADMEIMADVYDEHGNHTYYAWHHNGNVVNGWPISTYDDTYNGTVCDLDGDGLLDIVSVQGNYIVAYTFGHPYNPDNIEWGMQFHDLFLSNCHRFEPSSVDVLFTDFQIVGREDDVLVTWSVVSEASFIRFSVLRATRKDGPYVKISRDPIPAGEKEYLFIDEHIKWGLTYYYKIEATTVDGAKEMLGPRPVEWKSTAPKEFRLSQNYPNPFNPTTHIRYSLRGGKRRQENGGRILPNHTTLKIFNILGQEIRTLVDEVQEPGHHTVTWDGRDRAGHEVPSGIYFYRLETGGFVATRRMLLLK